ncbi:MAG TPA: neutral/alkaline non-lysosomal ceramidase N-terminal domain-containing protein [Anaeromyxobacter sp.]|nr:neutral/alkaline non-lysosomal ceramidase N-terminal domain-containing protein [Anaeromyxobacter sp.]
MKKLLTTALAALLLVLLGIPAVLLGIGSLARPSARGPGPARVVAVVRGKGPLAAGVAEVPLDVPPGTPIAGFARLRYASEGIRDPLGVRALVLSAGGCRVALVSAEILLVPDSLVEAVRARLRDLPLDGLIVTATHTHAGPGGYWEDLLGERIATGPYDPAARDRLANAIALAVRRAASFAGPARLSLAQGRAEALQHNRDGGPRDGRLSVLRIEGSGGAPLAEVTLFAAHPTTLGGGNRSLSGDWAGRFLAGGHQGLRLLLQGALGDQSVSLDPPGTAITPEAYAAALGAAVDGLGSGPPDPAPALAIATVDVPLPPPAPAAVPAPLRRAVGALAQDLLPADASVTALRIGPLLLLGVPAEPVAAVGARWREAAGPDAEVVALANGYLGYVESAEQVTRGAGEADRTYYGPELEARLEKGIVLAAEAARGDAGRAGGTRR